MNSDTHKKMIALYSLLKEPSLSVKTFQDIQTALKGLNPKLDEKLEICSKALDKLQKLQKGDLITLSIEELPETTEEEKKRKKALLFFINSLKDLESEIKRIDEEFNKTSKEDSSFQSKTSSLAKTIGSLKGPFGIITLAAFAVVGLLLVTKNKAQNNSAPSATQTPVSSAASSDTPKMKIIMYNGKQIPLSELNVFTGKECDRAPHYHALNRGIVKALDQTILVDPGSCGFGKVKDVKIIEVPISPS